MREDEMNFEELGEEILKKLDTIESRMDILKYIEN